MPELGIVCAYHDRQIAVENLFRSKCANNPRIPFGLVYGKKNVPKALNQGAREIPDCRYIAFVHGDVFLPDCWDGRVLASIAALPKDWAVCGPAGATSNGELVRNLLSNGEQCGGPFENGTDVQTLDECCLIVNIEKLFLTFKGFPLGNLFDEENPAQHFYGADLCLHSLARGHVHVIDAPLEHNMTMRNEEGKIVPKPPNQLELVFFLSAGWLYGKHRDQLPIYTTCCSMRMGDEILEVTI